jgi:hypothetical protein
VATVEGDKEAIKEAKRAAVFHAETGTGVLSRFGRRGNSPGPSWNAHIEAGGASYGATNGRPRGLRTPSDAARVFPGSGRAKRFPVRTQLFTRLSGVLP